MANRASKLDRDDDSARRSDALRLKTQGHGISNAIDVVHLSHQSLGDHSLERELLFLFDRQAARIVARLRASIAGGASDLREASDLAHTLKGSALIIGARRVAKAAEALETALNLPIDSAALQARIVELDAVVDEAGMAIAEMLAA